MSLSDLAPRSTERFKFCKATIQEVKPLTQNPGAPQSLQDQTVCFTETQQKSPRCWERPTEPSEGMSLPFTNFVLVMSPGLSNNYHFFLPASGISSNSQATPWAVGDRL